MLVHNHQYKIIIHNNKIKEETRNQSYHLNQIIII